MNFVTTYHPNIYAAYAAIPLTHWLMFGAKWALKAIGIPAVILRIFSSNVITRIICILVFMYFSFIYMWAFVLIPYLD